MNRRTLIASAALAALAAAQPANAAGIQNGFFSDGLTGWTEEGDIVGVSTLDGYTYVRMEESFFLRDEETGEETSTPDPARPRASRSRLYQQFVVSDETTDLSFRFRFASSPRTRASTVPPDAFTAHLLDAATGQRVLPGTDNAPKFSSAFFYIDSDRNLVYDDEHVTVQATPGDDGMYGVTLHGLSAFANPPQTLRLEFNFATAHNGVTSAVFMDGVADGSMTTPYSGLVATGTGTATGGAGTINIDVPGDVVQAMLYWSGEHRSQSGDDTVAVTINGGVQQSVTGEILGQGAERFFYHNGWVYASTYRADITALGGLTAGANAVQISGMDFDYGNDGAGLLVKYSNGSDAHVGTETGTQIVAIAPRRGHAGAGGFRSAGAADVRRFPARRRRQQAPDGGIIQYVAIDARAEGREDRHRGLLHAVGRSTTNIMQPPTSCNH